MDQRISKPDAKTFSIAALREGAFYVTHWSGVEIAPESLDRAAAMLSEMDVPGICFWMPIARRLN